MAHLTAFFVNWYLLNIREPSIPVDKNTVVMELEEEKKAVSKVSEAALEKISSILLCRHLDGTADTGMPDYLEEAIFNLMIMHMVVFLMHIVARCILAYSVKNFSHHLLFLVAVPVYITVLIQGYFAVVDTEINTMLQNCLALNYMQKRSWIYIELVAWLVVIVYYMLYLFLHLRFCGGG